jgi:hypothetical protein
VAGIAAAAAAAAVTGLISGDDSGYGVLGLTTTHGVPTPGQPEPGQSEAGSPFTYGENLPTNPSATSTHTTPVH